MAINKKINNSPLAHQVYFIDVDGLSKEQLTWLFENIKNDYYIIPNINIDQPYKFNITIQIHFIEESDATAFKLRWS